MRTLSIDLETYSSADISKTGVYKYAEAADFEVLLFGYSVDGGAVQVVDLAQGETLPTDIRDALTDERILKTAYNAQFERVCLSRYLGLPTGQYLPADQWHCTMVWAAYLSLPLSLAGAGAALGLDKQKLDVGKPLIRYFCVPCAPTATNGQRTRNLPADAPAKWRVFKSYNLRDVETEREIQQKLSGFPVPDSVWREYWHDQEINDRGIALDMTLVTNAISIDAQSRDELTAMTQELTNLDNPNSVQQMKQWLCTNGLEVDSLGKKQVAELLKTAPQQLRDVLSLRQQLAKSSVKKYQAMEAAVCADGRARGMFQFYGAARTGRYSGRLIQLQNLPQNHMPDLESAREVIRSGDYAAARMLYDSVPDVLSELIRTAFVPKEGAKFIVADFSAIEARVIAWLAGESWRQELFARGGDIYCQSASQMFRVPVEKHGINGHLRQKGKVAELACIAEGQPVLTDQGLIPIEQVTIDQRVWDGISWVRHDGVVYRGEKEVICYEGLTATPDHLVWVEGQSQPIQFGLAASSGAHLIQTGHGRRAIRLGEDYFSRETLEQELESLPCSDTMRWVWLDSMASARKPHQRKKSWMPAMFQAQKNPEVAQSSSYSGEAAVRKPKRPRLQELWRARDKIRISKCNCCGHVSDRTVRAASTCIGAGSNRQQWGLCARKHSLCSPTREQRQSPHNGTQRFFTRVLALCQKRRCTQAFEWDDAGRGHRGRRESGCGETKKLAHHIGKARLYDIRNAGPNHRFTVSGKLVHNCGYGGSTGALKAMGALDMGLKEDELKPLVTAWREANPNIVQLWWDVDEAAMTAIAGGKTTRTETHGIIFERKSGMLFVTLPSGRQLAYAKPQIGENQFGSPAMTYMGTGATKKWERLETYGPKLCENITQAISRDVLCYAMNSLRHYPIVAHVHDEVIIEADPQTELSAVCGQMGNTPPWAKGLILRADGYETQFYKKD